jgi:hypothetical protein
VSRLAGLRRALQPENEGTPEGFPSGVPHGRKRAIRRYRQPAANLAWKQMKSLMFSTGGEVLPSQLAY